MQVHLSRFDLDVLRQQAAESLDLGDQGESFAEEAVTRFGEEDLLVIEDYGEVDPHEFMAHVFQSWADDVEPEDIVDTLMWMLEDLDIELTYDAEDEHDIALDEAADWDDDITDADDEQEEFAKY